MKATLFLVPIQCKALRIVLHSPIELCKHMFNGPMTLDCVSLINTYDRIAVCLGYYAVSTVFHLFNGGIFPGLHEYFQPVLK